jgi:hypothetical protein
MTIIDCLPVKYLRNFILRLSLPPKCKALFSTEFDGFGVIGLAAKPFHSLLTMQVGGGKKTDSIELPGAGRNKARKTTS